MSSCEQLVKDLEARLWKFQSLQERAQRLVNNASWQLGGCLSSESRAKDIPSKAGSWVTARNLASLRDALRDLNRG